MKRTLVCGLILPVAALLALVGVMVNPGRSRVAEAAPAAINVSVISQTCQLDGSVTIAVTWNPLNQGMQFVELSMADNGFSPGTFVNTGQLIPLQSTLTWSGLLPGRLHFLRVNTLTPSGFVPSSRFAFVTATCATRFPLVVSTPLNVISQTCLGRGSVRVVIAVPTGVQGTPFVDLSLIDNGFRPGSFLGFGQVMPFQSSFVLDGLIPGQTHFLRINTLTPAGFQPLPRVAFVTPIC